MEPSFKFGLQRVAEVVSIYTTELLGRLCFLVAKAKEADDQVQDAQ